MEMFRDYYEGSGCYICQLYGFSTTQKSVFFTVRDICHQTIKLAINRAISRPRIPWGVVICLIPLEKRTENLIRSDENNSGKPDGNSDNI